MSPTWACGLSAFADDLPPVAQQRPCYQSAHQNRIIDDQHSPAHGKLNPAYLIYATQYTVNLGTAILTLS